MKLKLQRLGDRHPTAAQQNQEHVHHSEAVLGVGWLNSDEVLSCSDDHQLLKWNIASGKAQPINLSNGKENYYPTSLRLARRSDTAGGASGTRPTSDVFLITSSDGKIHLINTSGKVEKVIDAHQGAALSARWSNDGTGFVSSGEDGAVKMWSRSGMLRSVLVQTGRAAYAADWNPQSNKVAYCSGEECFIKMLKAQTSPIKWKAHQGTVLCLEWCAATDTILTGGEDSRYRLWDGLGRPLYTSNSHNHPITALAWNPTGELFAIGSYNILRLCDRAGWSHCLEKPTNGSVYSLSWSADGTQLVAGCATGAVLHAQVIEKRLMWENLEAVQIKRKTVNIRDLTSEVGQERLETRDRVTKLQLGFNYLVVATTKQFYIFSARNWNTPVIVDLKEGAVSLILLCEKSFLMVLDSIGGSGVGGSGSTIQTLNYDGRVQTTIRLPTSGGEPLSEYTSAISNDVVIIRDRAHHHTIHLFETLTGKSAGDGKIRHTVDVVEVAVNQCGSIAERRLAFVDTNGECWLAMVNSYGVTQRAEKIGSLISDLHFNTTTNMLSAFQDQSLVVWTYPSVVFTDKDLLTKTMINLSNAHDGLGSQSSALGKSSTIIGFIGNTITIRRSDGCLTAFYVPPFIVGLLNCTKASKWDHSVRICRTIKEDYLWATLAGIAAAEKNYTVAEICYGQLLETEKVLLLGEIRSETDPQLKNAMMALFNGNRREADMALVQNGRYFRAIMANLAMFKFDRALELAIKSSTHLDTILGYRQRYLEQTGRKETDPKFLKYLSQVEIDWPHIREKIQEDEEKEKLVR